MKEVRKVLKTYLKTLCPKVYFLHAPQKAIFPYLVYDLQIYPNGEGEALVTLDIDGWDSNITNDTEVVETLMETIKPLDKKTLTTDNLAVTFYLENEMALTDTDPNIHRRKYTYAGRLINY